jgi:hypothetical protein
MINTQNKTKTNGKDNQSEISVKEFFSLKNSCFFEYENEFEENMMILCEAHNSFVKYEPFDFKMVNITTQEVERHPAIVTETEEEGLIYIILSDHLAANPQFGEGIRTELQKSKSVPVTLALNPTNYLLTEPLPLNFKFLYEFALVPHKKKAFLKIKEILEFVSEITLSQLKKQADQISIYQLLYHRALRADLDNELLNDNTIITASPLINSIIKNL